MKKILSILILICIAEINLNGQILYEISGNGLKNSSFLFGTHHAVPVSSVTKVDNVFKCFNDCNAVVGEIVVDETDMNNKMLKMASMEEEITDFLTPEEENLVDSALQAELNIPLKQLAHLRPAIIQNIYEMTIYEKKFPRKEDDSQMDSFFQRAAKELGKHVYGLETIDQQLKILLHTQSLERQAEMLVNSVKTTDSLESDMKRLNELYLKGDIYELYKWLIVSEDYSEADKFLLIDERNSNWIDKIEQYMKLESCFIAVGALHLPGRMGLIEQLRRKGYHVKPVK